MNLEVFGRTENHEVIEIDAEAETLELGELDVTGFEQPLHVTVEITRTAGTAYLKGTVETAVRLQCARCLELFLWRLTSDFVLVVKQLREGEVLRESGQDDDEATSMLMLPWGENEVDIAPYVRDAVILTLPMKPVCREDCSGLCPVCGKNISAGPCGCVEDHHDSRWEALKGLYDEGGGEKK